MLVGAYRDNEVDAAHPLARKLEAIRQAGSAGAEIRLAPLAADEIGQLIADALRCEPQRAAPLAQLVHAKTAGNPFFVIQFLYALAEERLLRFDHDAACWSWDLDRIHAKGYTDNVVDLMVGKLDPPTGRNAAGVAAARLPRQCRRRSRCFRSFFGTSEEQVHAALWPAVRQELVERLEGSYKFIHDRVQEAAYSLIPEAVRAEVHLRIGRLLAAQTPPEKREEAIFDIVGQLNRGAALIAEQQEQEQLAELNLIAGKRAKGSSAYASALTYLNAGAALLAEECWERRRELIFAAGAEPGRMRILDRPDIGRRGAIGCAVKSRHDYGRTSHRRVLAHGCLHDPRSERPRGRGLSRLPPACRYRVVRPSDRRRRCDANTSASGHCLGAGQSRISSICR